MTPRTYVESNGPRFALHHPAESILGDGPFLFRRDEIRSELAAREALPSTLASLGDLAAPRSRRRWRDPLEECSAIASQWDVP